MFGRKKGAKGEPTVDDYRMYLGLLVVDFLEQIRGMEGQTEGTQKALVDQFCGLTTLRIAGGPMAGGLTEHEFLALARIHTWMVLMIDERLGYPPHSNPFDLIAELSEKVRSSR